MIEYEFVDMSGSPPGGWSITIPQTGIKFKHYDFRAMSSIYKAHCNANGILLSPNWQDEFLSEMCKQNPHWGLKCRPVTGKRSVAKKISLTAILSFLNMLKTWAQSTLSGKSAFVSQEEAERRASICAACPFNSPIQFSCGACMGAVLSLMQVILGKRKTSIDDALGACLVCSCSLKAAVHVPIDVQWDGLSQDIKDEFSEIKHCWKNK